jgi:hypothetical protein|eukprot:COSAG06_NODE_4486_length_4209_cov_65.094161_4_plen_98_part_00
MAHGSGAAKLSIVTPAPASHSPLTVTLSLPGECTVIFSASHFFLSAFEKSVLLRLSWNGGYFRSGSKTPVLQFAAETAFVLSFHLKHHRWFAKAGLG